MTGFARAVGSDGVFDWIWEAKSVNSRGLDTRFRPPPGHEELDPIVREAVAKRFKRGAVSVSLNVSRLVPAQVLRINRDLLNDVVALHKDLAGQVDSSLPRLEGLLAIKGVVETVEEPEDEAAHRERIKAMCETLDDALQNLAAMRAVEGERLKAMLAGQLEDLSQLSQDAAATAALRPEAIKARLKEQVAALLESDPPLSEDRLLQEAALIAAKADVREELDRLQAHLSAASDLLEEETAIGRKLDFLCQELNREANTLCAKSSDVDLTRIGLAIKAAVEQFREQVQNIE